MEDFAVQDGNWFMHFVILKAGSWFEDQKLLVSTRWIASVSWADKEVLVPHSRDAI